TFSKKIKLGPAIGDWTTIQYRDPDLEEISISQVQDINFDSLPKDQLRFVHLLHYRLAEKLVAKLSVDMNIKVELHTIVASQTSYEDFLQSQKDNVIQSDFIIADVGRVNAIFEWNLADVIVNRLVGGRGEETEDQQFSEIEIDILRTQMQELVPLFSDSWKNVFNPNSVKMEFICGKYVHDKKISLREAYVMFTFYMYFGRGDLKKVIWAYPNHVIRQLMDLYFQVPDPIEQLVHFTEKTKSVTKFEVNARLGNARLTMGELKTLQVGDVIPLDTLLDEPLEVKFGQSVSLFGQPGVLDNKLCVQLIMLDEIVKTKRPQRTKGAMGPEKELTMPLGSLGSEMETKTIMSGGVDTEDPVAAIVVPQPVEVPVASASEKKDLFQDEEDDAENELLSAELPESDEELDDFESQEAADLDAALDRDFDEDDDEFEEDQDDSEDDLEDDLDEDLEDDLEDDDPAESDADSDATPEAEQDSDSETFFDDTETHIEDQPEVLKADAKGEDDDEFSWDGLNDGLDV
ncbi:MAG: flagellar motor switch protein FliM, partial [Candidatus Marinamargulisbacteria bacterium]